ncbi:MAG: diphthamide biosynthesis enzyme Dph2 [Thermoprotei archaeon]|nr:MAG: diphthamide biosynthesis enzyme Dph2 [Thermoprotei archaeon]
MSKEEYYDFNLELIVKEILRRKAKKVLVQVPDGLKHLFLPHLEELKSRLSNVDFIVSGDPAYGGCFLAEAEAKMLRADLIVHIGHTEYYRSEVPSIYIEAFSKTIASGGLIEELTSYLKDIHAKKVGLCAVLQHLNMMHKVKTILEENGIKVFIGKHGPYTRYNGQIVGCDYVSALSINDDVEAHVIISGGLFHPLGLGLATLRPIVKIDPYENKITDMSSYIQKILKKRYWEIMRSLDAEKFGIIVGFRKGQFRPKIISNIEEIIREKKKTSMRIVMDIVTEERLANLGNFFDAYIITSCPRIPIDNIVKFKNPVLTPGEAHMVLTGKLEKYRFPW